MTGSRDSDIDQHVGERWYEEGKDDNRYPDGTHNAAPHGIFSDRREYT